MDNIELAVEEAASHAEFFATNCSKIIAVQGLAEAMDYCSNQNIEPPQCSLIAQSKNADKMRAIATRMLCEVKWWKRRLKNKGAQDFEFEQIKNNKVTRFISDETLEYQVNKKKKT